MRLSVIIPVYDVREYIFQCLDSVINQTLRDIEIIIVDDGTPDDCGKIADEYAVRDSRIKVIHQKNAGLSAARNAGMAIATTPFVMFVDSDDYVQPDYCEKMLTAVSNGADVAVCGINFIYEADAHLAKSDAAWSKIPPADVRWTPSVAWNKIYRMSIIREHDLHFPDGLKNEDEFFWNAYQPWCRDIVFVDEKLYNYRRRRGSIMGAIFSEKLAVRPDCLKIAAALGEYYDKQGLMRGEWGAHYWAVFDSLVNIAQTNRPKSPRRKRRLRRIWDKIRGRA